MNVGDTVILVPPYGYSITQSWIITALKSTDRGIWIQIDDNRYGEAVWHAAKYYKVTNESR